MFYLGERIAAARERRVIQLGWRVLRDFALAAQPRGRDNDQPDL
jgi:hypothetical protein